MTTARPAHRVRRALVAFALVAALPAALGTAPAAAYTSDGSQLASTELDGTATVTEAPQLAPAGSGEADAFTSPDIIRVDLVTPKSCTYADKNYSHGSVVKMDGGVLRECKDGSWVAYVPPPKS